MSVPLIIDGSYGEGGGQILRSTLALSIITGKSVQIVHIRVGRKKPGLQPQHLTSVKSAAAISNARVKGAEVNSINLEFTPHPVQAGNFNFDVGTAGEEVTATISPVARLQPLNLTHRGALRRITVHGLTSNLPERIAQRACKQAASLLGDLGVKPKLEIRALPSIGQGMMVLLVAELEHSVVGFDAMGQIGKRAEQVAEEAVQRFLDFLRRKTSPPSRLRLPDTTSVRLSSRRSLRATPSPSPHPERGTGGRSASHLDLLLLSVYGVGERL